MHVSSIPTVTTHDALAVNHRSTSTDAPQPNNVNSNDSSAVGTNQNVDLGANAVTASIDDDILNEVIEEHHAHKLRHANKRAMKVLRAGAKMIIKTVKEELKDLIKSLGITGQTNAAARHELNDFARSVRSEVKHAREQGNVDAAALGKAFQEDFDTFLSRLGELLSDAAGNPGDDDDDSVDLDPGDLDSTNVDPVDPAPELAEPVDETLNDLTSDDQAPIQVLPADPAVDGVPRTDVTPDDGQTTTNDPRPDGLERIALAFQEALANLMGRLELSAYALHRHGISEELLRGLMIDTHG